MTMIVVIIISVCSFFFEFIYQDVILSSLLVSLWCCSKWVVWAFLENSVYLMKTSQKVPLTDHWWPRLEIFLFLYEICHRHDVCHNRYCITIVVIIIFTCLVVLVQCFYGSYVVCWQTNVEDDIRGRRRVGFSYLIECYMAVFPNLGVVVPKGVVNLF